MRHMQERRIGEESGGVTSRPWVEQLRELHDESFRVDWGDHLENLNSELGLTGRYELSIPARKCPPSWFVGDVEALEPGRWVLVISLNQKRNNAGEGHNPKSYWDHWRCLHRKHWYKRFYRPRVRPAATALGIEITPEEEPGFATNSVIFVEMCPYASDKSRFSGKDFIRLTQEDPGFQTAADVWRILIEEASPALIMVNGVPAIEALEHLDRDRLTLGECHTYQSVTTPTKRLWHREGHFTTREHAVPAIAFPFRSPKAHYSYCDIGRLGDRAQVLVSESSRLSGP
ncbi:MAG: hypothetical protein F4Z25_08215 [Chloroflexi bacterium]|nr:hypothetical protein [Chloroflexota bacterium]